MIFSVCAIPAVGPACLSALLHIGVGLVALLGTQTTVVGQQVETPSGPMEIVILTDPDAYDNKPATLPEGWTVDAASGLPKPPNTVVPSSVTSNYYHSAFSSAVAKPTPAEFVNHIKSLLPLNQYQYPHANGYRVMDISLGANNCITTKVSPNANGSSAYWTGCGAPATVTFSTCPAGYGWVNAECHALPDGPVYTAPDDGTCELVNTPTGLVPFPQDPNCGQPGVNIYKMPDGSIVVDTPTTQTTYRKTAEGTEAEVFRDNGDGTAWMSKLTLNPDGTVRGTTNNKTTNTTKPHSQASLAAGTQGTTVQTLPGVATTPGAGSCGAPGYPACDVNIKDGDKGEGDLSGEGDGRTGDNTPETADGLLDPLEDRLNDFFSFTLPPHTAHCPAMSFDFTIAGYSVTPSSNFMCETLEDNRALFQGLMAFVYVFSAITIVLRA